MDYKGISNKFTSILFLNILIFFIIGSLLLSLFIQNFIYSESFEFLNFRRIDDIAFQMVLKDVHISLLNMDFKHIFEINNYSYGWIYWFPLSIITFPFYYFDSSWSEVLLIVIPREISLFWHIGTLFIVYKIMKYFTKDKQISLLSILAFVLFPSFGFYSSVFGTPTQIQFFAALSIYLALTVEKINTKYIIFIALAVATASATKITGIMILAIVGLLLLKRVNFKLNLSNVKLMIIFIFVFLFTWVILYDPSLLFFIFDKTILHNFVTNFMFGFSTTSVNVMGDLSIFDKFKRGIAGYTFHYFIAEILIMLIVSEIIIRYKKNEDFNTLLLFFLGVIVIIVFLFLSVHHGLHYLANYFTVANYSFLLGFIIFKRIEKKKSLLIIILLISFNFYLNFENFNIRYFSFFNSLEKSEKKIKIKEQIYVLLNKYDINKLSKLNIIREYDGLELFSPLRNNISEVISFLNFNTVKSQLDHYDIISLNKSDKKLKVPEEVKKLDRKEIENLIKTKRLGQVDYVVLFEDKEYLILISKNIIDK